MVFCVGCDPYHGRLLTYNTETDEKKSFKANKCDPKNEETILQLFEFIKTNVTKDSIDYFCVLMDFKLQTEFRRKFIEISKENNVKNVKIISPDQAYLCGAIFELSFSPKLDDEIWIFFIDENDVCGWIWEFDGNNGWIFYNMVSHERAGKGIDKSPTMEDFNKLKEKMKIDKEIPYIYVVHGDCVVNETEFKAVFPRNQKLIFQKGSYFAKCALNYALFMADQESFLKYKSESLMTYTIQIKTSNDIEICVVDYGQILPYSKITTVDLKSNEKLKMFEEDILISKIPIQIEGKHNIDLNIDANGVYNIKLALLDLNVDNSHFFTLPLKLNNYDPSLNAIGIDLGTSECCAAVVRKNGPDFVVLDIIRNSRTMPSFIAYDEMEAKFGQIVVDRMRFKSEYSVYDTKRILGKKMDEIIVDPLWPFTIISTSPENNTIEIETLQGKDLKTCEEITANLIGYIKNSIETYQGNKLEEAVITIPSEFSNRQKEATLKAAKIAGFTKIHFLPEPVAAAFAYFTEMKIPKNSNILICDCGGGTVDICIAKIHNEKINILNFDGDSQLGGRDFDTILLNHFSAILKHKFGIDIMKTKKKFVLKQKCQNIKHTLSAQDEDWLDVSDFDIDSDDIIKISREEFEEMSANLLLRIKSVICSAVSNANLQRSQIDYVFQVGGGCRMPMIKEMLKKIFPDSNNQCHLYPDWVVAHGAALYAYQIATEEQQREMANKVKFQLASKNQSNKLIQTNHRFEILPENNDWFLKKASMDKYINLNSLKEGGGIKGLAQVGGTSYANACALIIYLALKKNYKREGNAETFEEIRDQMIKEYGNDVAFTGEVLEEFCKKYRLRSKEIGEDEARIAISRHCLAFFHLTLDQWADFTKFYQSNPKGILKKSNLSIAENAETYGHAVILMKVTPEYFLFMNSWGTEWADDGFFKVKNNSVLNCRFYDVFWELDDLTFGEKAVYEEMKKLALE